MRAMAVIWIYVDDADQMGSSSSTQGEEIEVSGPDTLSAENGWAARRLYMSLRQQSGKEGVG